MNSRDGGRQYSWFCGVSNLLGLIKLTIRFLVHFFFGRELIRKIYKSDADRYILIVFPRVLKRKTKNIFSQSFTSTIRIRQRGASQQNTKLLSTQPAAGIGTSSPFLNNPPQRS